MTRFGSRAPDLAVKHQTAPSHFPVCYFEPLRCLVLTLGEAMRRREFVTLLGAAAAAWPLVTRPIRESQDAIGKLGLQSEVVEARTPEEFETGFANLKARHVDGVVILADPVVVEHKTRIAELALAARLPTAFQRRENVEAGGLFSYGGNIPDQFKYAASYVDRILKGAKPADLPVEQPTQFDFTANLRTAKTLGLTIPLPLLVTANEVFQ
jgi:putative tryptophan/tyrosine transport system substrate-binding protein